MFSSRPASRTRNQRSKVLPRRTLLASTLASKGINTFILRDLLGHTSTRTTKRYLRPNAETLSAVARALS
jgi:site-specific recombinase XerD